LYAVIADYVERLFPDAHGGFFAYSASRDDLAGCGDGGGIHRALPRQPAAADGAAAAVLRDPLTGQFNRRFLEETLIRELRRAQRLRMEMSEEWFTLNSVGLHESLPLGSGRRSDIDSRDTHELNMDQMSLHRSGWC
jgi:hypothetical protein